MNINWAGAAADTSSATPATDLRAGLRRFLVPVGITTALLLIGVVIFRSFVIGDRVLLFKDIGADSVNDSYPYLVHLSDYIRNEGFPSWSFYVGMGQSLFYLAGNLVWDPIVWLPRELIARAIVYQHLFKTLLAGLLFFRFLQLRGVNVCASFLGSLLLAFSSYMCMGSCWLTNADEVVGFTFVLFAAELAVSRGRWVCLAIAIALIGLTTVFHLYLSAVLLCLYVPARLIEIYGWRRLEVSHVSLRLAAVAFLGVGLAAVLTFGSAYCMVNSPRGSGTIPNFTWGPRPSLFQLQSAAYYVSAVLRPFSADMVGTGDDFRGWENYFESPSTYCGLLSLLLFPQVFIQGGYFRAFSLFSVFGVVALSMTAFSRYTEGRSFGIWTLGVSLLILLGVLYFPLSEMQARINPQLKQTAAILLVTYAALLIIGHVTKWQTIVAWIIVLLAVIELVYFNRLSLERPTVTKQELNSRVGFNDETVDAVHDITASEKSFFRITKTWGSGPATRESYNDAMVFGYYGTMCYSSFNNLDYIKFLLAVDAISRTDIATDAQWSPGLVGHPLLSTFACEKYVITRDPVVLQTAEQYEFVKRYGDTYVFRNQVSLPFGLIYTQYIPEGIFLPMPGWAKPEALLHAAVLSDEESARHPELLQLTLNDLKQQISETPVPDALVQRRAAAADIHSFTQTRIEATVRLNQQGIIVFQTPFDGGWHAFVDGRPAPTLKVDVGLLGVEAKEGEHNLELRYRPPLLYAGIIASLLSLVGLSLSLRKWPRIRLPS